MALTPEQAVKKSIIAAGVGGAGINCIDYIVRKEKKLSNVEYISVDTDADNLGKSCAQKMIQLGLSGLCANGDTAYAKVAAIESKQQIISALSDACLFIIITGGGGGTGSGAAPVIAKYAKETGVPTVAFVTVPFEDESADRAKKADDLIAGLKSIVGAVFIMPNEKLKAYAGDMDTGRAFALSYSFIYDTILFFRDVIHAQGQINTDYADLIRMIRVKGEAFFGACSAEYDDCVSAAKGALCNPLLETTFYGAKDVLVSVKTGNDASLDMLKSAITAIYDEADPDAEIMVGTEIDESFVNKIGIAVFAVK